MEPDRVLFNNFSNLKSLAIRWARRKRKLVEDTLMNIKTELGNMTGPDGLRFLSSDTKDKLILLEMEKAKLLRKQEEEWRLKSKVIWLQAGDDNTKFFNNVPNE